ncbi:RNA ligase family protein [Mycobacteroides salmoniphilum]|uniref:RNA ligase family protein n=1 Tax=Mycobacteroides salmoniphilum TaxID=404941 RepID=UPI001AD822ED|nr:RNA ligase family protein [Mycobacteroides salmoniphilum]
MTFEFKPWPKTPRLNGASMVITEKIDGTNACIIITEDGEVGAQSRNRLITKENDNYGFARWVDENQGQLLHDLGTGYHYGEWWGSGIQSGYGLVNGEKRFSLFNTGRWADEEFAVPGLGVVPVLFQYQLDTHYIAKAVQELSEVGSKAAPGFMNPEGVIVYIPRANQVFKVLIENDDIPKGLAA